MSLRVWLPLNGNLENKGLSDLSFRLVDSSTTVLDDGKIAASSYINSNTSGGGIISNKTLHIGDNLSMFAWVKLSSFNGSDQGHLTGIGGMHTIKHLSGTDFAKRTGMGITVHSSGRIGFNWGDENGRLGYLHELSSQTITTNNWHHIGFTCQREGITSTITLYIDGKKDDNVYTIDNIQNPDDYVHLFSWSRNGEESSPTIFPNYKPSGQINDFRIYDHCLTEDEVKLLAQGLVAHYPLKAPFLPNLLQGAEKWTKEKPLVRKVSDAPQNAWDDSFVYHTECTVNITRPGTYIFTLWADGVPEGHQPGNINNTVENRKYMICLRNKSNNAHPIWKDFTIAKDGKHYGLLELQAGNYDLRTNLYVSKKDSSYTVKLWDMQLFESDQYIPELFEPVLKEYQTKESFNKIYGLDECFCQDVSGYGNRMRLVGNIVASKTTSPYFSCACFNNSGYLYNNSFNLTMEQFSISFRVKPPKSTKSQHFLFGTFNSWPNNGIGMWRNADSDNDQQADYSFLIGRGANNYKETSVALKVDVWSHVALTYNGQYCKIFINGLETTSFSFDNSGSVEHLVLYLGTSLYASGSNTLETEIDEACLSDFRFYAQVLSDDEIVTLSGSRTLFKNNVMTVREFVETNNEDIIQSNGPIAGNFSEIDAPLSNMKIKALPDGSTWTRIHHLNLEDQPYVFTNDEIGDCDKYGKYDKTSLIDNFKYNAPGQGAQANYEFMLTYPSIEKGLPKGYTQLEYIESTGQQWIDTGVTTNARWEFDIQFPDKEYPLIPQLTQNDNHIILEESRKTHGSFRIKEDQRWRAYMAFDRNHNTAGDVCYGHGYGIGVQLGYDFSGPHYVSSILLDAYVDSSQSIIKAQIQGKIQGNWFNLVTLTPENFTNHVERSYEINRDGITAIKLVTFYTSNDLGIIIREMQAYGHKRQLMGYGGDEAEYWGVQQDRRYGIYADTTLDVFAGHRDAIVHDCSEPQFRLWVKDAEVTVGTQNIADRQYQLFTIASNLGYTCNAKLYRCNCIENGKLIRQFIPARRNSDKEVGLYDLAEGVFYTNNSPEPYPFLAGPEIETYQQIDYIESTGGQYINTGFVPNQDTKIECAFLTDNMGNNEVYFYGSGEDYNKRAFELYPWEGNLETNYGKEHEDFRANIVGQYTTIVRDKTGFTINGTPQSVATDPQTFTCPGPLYLFALNRNNSPLLPTKGFKMYYFKIYNNDVLVRDYVPVVSSSGRYGLLDRVNNQFYPSETGEFGYHQQLSYIESTGTQHFITDVMPSADLETEIAFTPTGSLQENAIFGSAWSAEGYFLMFYQNQIRWHSGGNWVDIGSFKPGDRVVCHCTNSYITVNGNKTNIDGGANIQSYITILDNMGYSAGRGIGKIEYVKMWSGGALIRHLVPVKSSFTNRVRLYDLITKRFYDNVGTGNMIAGPEIKQIPACPIEQYNRWIQISSPNSPYCVCQGYRPIHTDFVRWDGYKHTSGPITRSFDQSKARYQINNSGDLWGLIGQKVRQGKGIRAANGTVQYETELWVRFDNMPNATEIKIRDGSISAPDFIEY